MSIYEVRACPRCGAESVSGNDFLGPSYTCGDCDWRYKQGLLGDRGTHPEEFDRYCSDCRTVFGSVEAADHVCTVVEALEGCDSPVTFAALVDELTPYRSRDEVGQDVKTGVWQRTVAVHPDSRLVPRDDPTGRTDMHALILDLLGREGGAAKRDILARTDIDSDWGEEYVQQCLRELASDGAIRVRPGHNYRLAD